MSAKKNDKWRLNFEKGGGLVPAIVQDFKSGEVLMLAYMNEEAWQRTLESGKAHYYSRSRQSLWLKGETSGMVQLVREIRVDCDLDTVLLKVEQTGGAACHTGHGSCFYRRLDESGELITLSEPLFDPEEVYKK
jgi:phosphoribosyl-AMP cyclohydrolase